jgi:hypothetical protein
VCDCRSGSQGGGDYRGLDHLGVGCTCLARVTAVDIDAIRALSSESNGDGRLVKGPKGFMTSGGSRSIFFNLARFSLLYICVIMFHRSFVSAPLTGARTVTTVKPPPQTSQIRICVDVRNGEESSSLMNDGTFGP